MKVKYMKVLDDNDNQKEVSITYPNETCPNCGYCPHCGRPYHVHPWGYPYPGHYKTTWGTTSTNNKFSIHKSAYYRP